MNFVLLHPRIRQTKNDSFGLTFNYFDGLIQRRVDTVDQGFFVRPRFVRSDVDDFRLTFKNFPESRLDEGFVNFYSQEIFRLGDF